MNQKEAYTILYEATIEMDHLPHVRRARKFVAKRIATLDARYTRMRAAKRKREGFDCCDCREYLPWNRLFGGRKVDGVLQEICIKCASARPTHER